MNTEQATVASETSSRAYEALRARIVHTASRPASELGLGVLLHRGLLAWMRLHPVPATRISAPTSRVDAARVSTQVHDEIVHVMVAMTMTSSVLRDAKQEAVST